MFKKLTLITALALSPIAANADLLEFDWQTQGDGDITLDTKSGKLWLDLDVTVNKSIDTVRALTENDANFTNWRLPTLNEIHTLSSSLFSVIGNPSSRYSQAAITPQEYDSFAVFGPSIPGFTYGLYENNGNSHLFGAGSNGLFLNYQWASGTTFNRFADGVYLVSDNYSVSIDEAAINSTLSAYNASSPAVIGALSLFGLALFGRHKKAK